MLHGFFVFLISLKFGSLVIKLLKNFFIKEEISFFVLVFTLRERN